MKRLCVVFCLLAWGVGAVPGEIKFTLKEPRHVTLAVDSAQGVRVRNLLADTPYPAGEHTVEWDGRDDAGKKLPPGDYKWTGLTHAPIHALYEGAYSHGTPPWSYGTTGGWTADHSYVAAIVNAQGVMLLGSTESEWGTGGLIGCTPDGRKLWGKRWLDGKPWAGADALVTDGKRVFAGSYVQAEGPVWEINPLTGECKIVWQAKGDIPASLRNVVGAREGLEAPRFRLAGFIDDELFLTDIFGKLPYTYVFKIGTEFGAPLTFDRALNVRAWQLIKTPGGQTLAIVNRQIVALDTKTGSTKDFIATGLSNPYDLVAAADGTLYVSDMGATGMHAFNPYAQLKERALHFEGEASHQIKLFTVAGKPLSVWGRKGGQQPGLVNPNDFWRPAGLAFDPKGRLWVSEMTYQPKRVSVWEPAGAKGKQKLAAQFIGPGTYGGGGVMVNPDKPWEIMDTNYGTVFDVNLDKQTYDAVSFPFRQILARKEHAVNEGLPFDGKPTRAFPLEGRTFAVMQGGYEHGPEATWEPYSCTAAGVVGIGEYTNNVFRPLGAFGNVPFIIRMRELDARREVQWVPKAVMTAAKALPDWPRLARSVGLNPAATDTLHLEHKRGSPDWIVNPWPREIGGFKWTDANGDGSMQPEEIVFFPMGDADRVTFSDNLDVYLPQPKKHGDGTLVFKREGFNACGAPTYPDKPSRVLAGVTDVRYIAPDGSLLTMNSLRDRDGKPVWTYPADPRGARDLGAEGENLLERGTMHRLHALRGVAPLEKEQGDVMCVQSTDGMLYFLTREDGLFITTLFRPFAFAAGWDSIPQAARGMRLDEYSLQDECFNGSFQQARASGKGFEKDGYYLIGFGRSAIARVTGLDSVTHLPGGTVSLMEGVGLYAAARVEKPKGDSLKTRAIDREPLEVKYGTPPQTCIYIAGSPIRFAWDKRGLIIKAEVADVTPRLNKSGDQTMLFATGDGVDLFFKSPKYRRIRIVLAPTPQAIVADAHSPGIAVRYHYDGAPTSSAVAYKSGVGQADVTAVEKLDADVRLRPMRSGYVLETILSWQDLGIDPAALPAPGGKQLNLDFEAGILQSDAAGSKTQSRYYWSGHIGMVADIPTEAAPVPNWGKLQICPPPPPEPPKQPPVAAPVARVDSAAPVKIHYGLPHQTAVKFGQDPIRLAWDKRGLILKAELLRGDSSDGFELQFTLAEKPAARITLQPGTDGKGVGKCYSGAASQGTVLNSPIRVRAVQAGYVLETILTWDEMGATPPGTPTVILPCHIKAIGGTIKTDALLVFEPQP